ncbi:hypothetical protein BASA81_010010 [Batrachochytrium salamandrivorans]|nr:hypothetical protein BASA81_010010 [Batrachochytrium salamandrivorans]
MDTKRLRSVEKRRTSTCLFADSVAELVLKRYREIVISDEQARTALQSSQTCIAAFVVLVEGTGGANKLVVASLGVGTKIVSESTAELDSEHGRVVLDSHAEVLARRGLVRFLYHQLELLEQGEEAIFDSERGLKPNVSFHLYSSSSPCGNSCVRRWAKGQTEKFRDDLGQWEWPDPAAHGKFQVHSALQTAVLCKVKVDYTPSSDGDGGGESNPLEIPPGTALKNSPAASSRATCSDKVARWCRLGVQGALLGSLLQGPICPTSVIVGRKFSRPHLERAICCRVKPLQCRTSVMCTAVQVQHGGLEGDARSQVLRLLLGVELGSRPRAGVRSAEERT